jgi:hypothetical protein
VYETRTKWTTTNFTKQDYTLFIPGVLERLHRWAHVYVLERKTSANTDRKELPSRAAQLQQRGAHKERCLSLEGVRPHPEQVVHGV